MPLVRIDSAETISSEALRAVADIVHIAMVETLNVPSDDRFQVITSQPGQTLIADPQYLGITRSANSLFIQITLNMGRTVEMKKAFYAQVASNIAGTVDIRAEDILINLVEVSKENWSFGNGEAQYA